MSSKRCCVPQCAEIEDSQRVLHWFPNPEKDIVRFRTWVHAIGGDILSLSNENIYKLRRVCHAHCEEKYCCRNNRISNIAIPTLLMPGPLSISKCIYTDRKLFREVENLPSTSKGSLSLPESRKPLKENEKPSQATVQLDATVENIGIQKCTLQDKYATVELDATVENLGIQKCNAKLILLEYHIKASHTGERPLKCGICHLSFVYPEHYKKHVRIHSGERPYVCEICGKSFNSRDNRNTHRFVHSDKKPYECVACGAGYMRKQLLYAHMNTSGHLAESIVVNQPRVIKVTENGNQPAEITRIEAKNSKFDTIFDGSELEASVKSVVKAETEVNLEDAKFYITEDKKLILQDSDKTTLNLIQEGDESTLLTIHNIGERAEGTILEAVDADQLGEQTEIVTNDENGRMVRLIQIKLPDGNNGWVAINR